MKRKVISLALAMFVLGGVGTNIPMNVSANNDIVDAHSIESSDVSVVKITDSELADMGIVPTNMQRTVSENSVYDQYLIDFNNGYVAVERIYNNDEIDNILSTRAVSEYSASAVRDIYLKVLDGYDHQAVIKLDATFKYDGSVVKCTGFYPSGKTPSGASLNTYSYAGRDISDGARSSKATLNYKYGILQNTYSLYLSCDTKGNFSSNYDVR